MQTAELLRILACPKCHGELSLEGTEDDPRGFLCARCELVFPVEDAIPVMLLNQAIPLKTWKTTKAGAGPCAS